MVGPITKDCAAISSWENLKDVIRTLYLVEDNSLGEVKDKLAMEYDFDTTKAQLEHYFKKWDFRKNLSSEEWIAVAHKIAKRKRQEKESEVCIYGLPMKSKKVKKAISRYKPTSSLQVQSPRTPKGITISTPRLTPSGLRDHLASPLPIFFTLTSHVSTLLSSVPFMQFKSVVDIPAHTLQGGPGGVDSTLVSSTHDFQASIVEHFGGLAGGKDLSTAFQQSLKAVLPENVVNRRATDLQMIRPSRNSSHAVDFLDLTLFMVSNNFLSPDSDTSSELYEWIKRHSNAGLFEYLLTIINEPTIEALAEQLFSRAIDMEDVHIVQKILDFGFHPNELRCIGDEGHQITPLQRACELRNLDLVQLLVNTGADVNLCLSDCPSPLAYAVAHEDQYGQIEDHVELELIQILLRAGANVNPAPDSSPLLEAAANSHVELISILLAAGADPNFSDENTGMTPLHHACTSYGLTGDVINIVHQLLQAGADPSAECSSAYDEEGASVLEQSIGTCTAELIKLLLDGGARITERALIIAVDILDLDIIKLCLSYGARLTRKVIEAATACPKSDILWFLLDSAEVGITKVLRGAAFVAAIRNNHQALITTLSTSGLELRKSSKLEEAIEAAAYRGDLPSLRLLLDDGSPFQSTATESLGGALSSAISNGQVEVTDFLLTIGVDVNTSKFGSRSTPLIAAILKKDAGLIKRLLAAGAAVNTEMRSSNNNYRPLPTSVLPTVVSWGDYSCIRCILDAGADINAPDALNGKTALTVAVEKADFPTTQFLIDKGADVNAAVARATGHMALVASVKNDDMNMARFLLDLGADVHEEALIAAVAKSEDLVQMLLTTKLARSMRYPSGFGCRALQHAIAKSNAGMIQLLLTNGINPNSIVRHQYDEIQAREDDLYNYYPPFGYSNSALGLAIEIDKSKDLWVINKLLGGGANVNTIVDEARGLDALTAAVDKGDLRLVEMLLTAGADANLTFPRRMPRTPLQLAAERGSFEIAVVLLEHRAEINAPPYERYGATALQFAAINGYLGIAVVLVEKGADINAPPAKVGGRTALEGAAEHGRIDILQFLLNAGAEIKGSGTKQYERARKFASENGHIAARRLLERHHSQQPEHQTPGNSAFDFEAWNVWD